MSHARQLLGVTISYGWVAWAGFLLSVMNCMLSQMWKFAAEGCPYCTVYSKSVSLLWAEKLQCSGISMGLCNFKNSKQ